ncbi:MAG: DNA-binding protein WhiA [Butyrivibrio sp.]|uniref:DNA-binding protein WhiA n=1 Tax=Butyrivibrio sp. NC2002 TaxID=1410610 RepID=UPI000568DC61|nr:DNA-binding protein WhiA [Butyrivibrio sp. NC2002]MBE5860363.1 DNA-binding protein WhiA [Butyrivibrio sp.]
MSFSSEVKSELAKQIGSARHCQIAELSAIMHNFGLAYRNRGGIYTIYLQSDNPQVSRKFFTILKKAYNIELSVLAGVEEKHLMGRIYQPVLQGGENVAAILKAMHFLSEDGTIREDDFHVNPMVVRNSCCKRAYLRDAFLCIGSVSDPSKSYHLEFVCLNEEYANDLRQMIESFDIDARIITRKKYFVVYIKESTAIVDLLNVMEAPVSLMNMENERIVKEMRGQINRRVNCETANITKTVNAASRQINDILYLRDHYGFENLPEGLKQMAEARLQYPDATLLELGKYLDPPVGKSGVNHRLRKLGELADKLRS